MKLLRNLLLVALATVVLAPTVAGAATPMQGVPTQIRRGFFTETDFGAFFTLGGNGKSPSNMQAYFHLGAGYDLYAQGDHLLTVAAGLAMGTSAGSCYGNTPEPNPNGGIFCRDTALDADGEPYDLSSNWSATMVEGSVLYGYQVMPRLMLTGRLIGGLGFIQPKAFPKDSDTLPMVGLGVGAEWATQFDHFSLGLDIAGRSFLGTSAIAVSIAPRVKYTF